MPTLDQARAELDEYTSTLLGRKPAPFDAGIGTLMEYASASLGRALEMQALILRSETDGAVPKGSRWYRFRTGELRTFIDLAKDAVDLGSRRVTLAKMEYDMQGSV